jgi:hypothetical protein
LSRPDNSGRRQGGAMGQRTNPTFPTRRKVSDINTGIAKVSTTRRWLRGERSFLAR